MRRRYVGFGLSPVNDSILETPKRRHNLEREKVMSHFYGSIPCSARKTVPTARAHKSTGLTTVAASWAGAVRVYLWHDDKTGEDKFEVFQSKHHGAGIEKLLSTGVIGE